MKEFGEMNKVISIFDERIKRAGFFEEKPIEVEILTDEGVKAFQETVQKLVDGEEI